MTRRPAALCVLLFLMTGPARADSAPALPVTEDYLNLLRLDLRATKAEIVTNALELTPEELERFWPIYREYDAALVRLNEDRAATLRDFAAHYASIDDSQAQDLTRRSLEFQHKRLDLLKKYYGRMAKAFNPATAARFLQLEHQLLMLVDVQIASELPLIPRQVLASPAREG